MRLDELRVERQRPRGSSRSAERTRSRLQLDLAGQEPRLGGQRVVVGDARQVGERLVVAARRRWPTWALSIRSSGGRRRGAGPAARGPPRRGRAGRAWRSAWACFQTRSGSRARAAVQRPATRPGATTQRRPRPATRQRRPRARDGLPSAAFDGDLPTAWTTPSTSRPGSAAASWARRLDDLVGPVGRQVLERADGARGPADGELVDLVGRAEADQERGSLADCMLHPPLRWR